MNADRVLYLGLLGRPDMRVLGAYTAYASCGGRLELWADDGVVQSGDLVVVPPYVPHRIQAQDKTIMCLLMEPEHLDPTCFPDCLKPGAAEQVQADTVSSMRTGLARMAALTDMAALTNAEFDLLLLGQVLPARTLEPRVTQVLNRMCADPAVSLSAADCARQCQLSTSRFMHLFKSEVGCSFRNVRAWKRARNLLPFVKSQESLTTIALDLGYPDSSYFSHSIRHVTGLRPKDIMSGSRRVKVIRSQD